MQAQTDIQELWRKGDVTIVSARFAIGLRRPVETYQIRCDSLPDVCIKEFRAFGDAQRWLRPILARREREGVTL